MVEIAAPRPDITGLDITGEVKAWLEENWDPDLTVGEWWERLGTAGLGGADAARPSGTGGAPPARTASGCMQAIGELAGVLGAPGGLGLLLAAPDDRGARHRRAEGALPPRHRHRPARRGASCSASPAPAPTSPASPPRRCRTATSGSSTGRRCGRRAPRSPTSACSSPAPNPDVPKHQGITYFAFDMHQPGVEVRPLREMTGRAHVQRGVPHRRRASATTTLIGGVNNGWAVANTTLAFERAGLGAGGGRRRRVRRDARARAGDLDRAGRRLRAAARPAAARARAMASAAAADLLDRAGQGQRHDRRPDHPPRPHAAAHPQRDRAATTNLRAQGAAQGAGQEIPGPGQHGQARR